MLLRLATSQLTAPARPAGKAGPDGWRHHRLRFVAEGAAQGLLLGFGTDVEVLARSRSANRWPPPPPSPEVRRLYSGGPTR